jgi:hypothetical protein
VVAVALSAGSVAVAGPAGAQSSAPVQPVTALCTRAQKQWARLARANTTTKAAFERARSLQNQLVRAGRVGLAHRLDARLLYLRALHAHYLNRVARIATRVQGRCSASPPQLVSY